MKGLVDQERHVEVSDSENENREDLCDRERGQMNLLHEYRSSLEGKSSRDGVMGNDESLITSKAKRDMQEHMLIETRIHEKREEGLQKAKKKFMEKRKPEFGADALLDHRPYMKARRVPERHRASKRRRGGEVQFFSLPLHV